MSAARKFVQWLAKSEHHDRTYGYVYRYHPRSDAHSIALCRFTLQQLAARSGLAVSNIRNWEQDHRTPNIFALLKIARSLGRTMEEFVEGLMDS